MVFVLICTEGEVSEPAYIKALSAALGGQAPRRVSANVEILPIPLGGNQGHVRLLEVASQRIDAHMQSEHSLISAAGAEDVVEKWLVVDFDDMDTRGVDVEQLRRDALVAGYTLVVSKPNFEFFVLASMTDIESASAVPKDQFAKKINENIASLNEEDSKKGFSKAMLMPPKYSKKTHVAEKLFGMMLDRHPELIHKASQIDVDLVAERYTEMSVIVNRIIELYKR